MVEVMQNIDIVNITDEQANRAKLLASAMSEPMIRKRGMIDMLGIGCAVNYLYANRIRIDTKKSVHKIPMLFEEFKITDLYYGNYRIDVITLYKEKTVKIPKIHVDLDIMPHFYFIVQIGSKIKEAKMIGFIAAKDIPSCSHDSKFYYPTLDLLFDIKKFQNAIRHSVPNKPLLGKHVDCMGLFLKFIDNDLSSAYKKQLIHHLMNCGACRERFINVMEFERLAGNMKFYPNLIRHHGTPCSIESAEIEYQKANSSMSFEQSLEISDTVVPEIEENQPKEQKESSKEMRVVSPIVVPKTDIKQKSKKIIDTIFNEIPKIELPPIKVIMDAKHRRKLMIGVVLFFVFTSFAIISFSGSDNTISTEIPNDEQEQFNMEDDDFFSNLPPSTGEARLIPKQRSIDEFTIEAPHASQSSYTPTITRVSWEAPESLVKKEAYTKYLQLIGKNIKLNLQNDLLLVSDIPMNKVVKTDIKIAANGDVHSINVSSSSGSEQIDSMIEKTVNETLTYMKPPSHGIIARTADVTLTIELH